MFQGSTLGQDWTIDGIQRMLVQLENPATADAGLTILDEMLVSGEESQIQRLDAGRLKRSLTEIFYNSTGKRKIACASCISHLIGTHRRGASSIEVAFLRKVSEILTSEDADTSRELDENCVSILCQVAEEREDDVVKSINPVCFVKRFYTWNPVTQRKAVSTLRGITEGSVPGSFADALEGIGELITFCDELVVSHAVHAFANIAQKLPEKKITPDVVRQLVTALLVITDGDCVCALMRVVLAFVRSDALAEQLIANNIDFALVIDQTEAKGQFVKLLEMVLRAAQFLVPPPNGYEHPFKVRKLKGEAEFCLMLSSFIERLVIDHTGCVRESLWLLAALVRLHKPENIDKLNIEGILHALAGYSLVKDFVPNVFLVIQNLPTKAMFQGQDAILTMLKEANPDAFKEVFGSEFDTVVAPDRVHVDSIEKLETASGMKAWELWASKTLPEIINFLKTCTGPIDGQLSRILERLAKVCSELLQYLHLPSESDPLESFTAKAFKDKKLSAMFQAPESSGERHSLSLITDLLEVEERYNRKRRHVTMEQALAALREDPDLSRVLPASELTNATYSKGGLLHRACKTPGYRTFRFKINGKDFCAYDNIFHAFCASVSNPTEIRTQIPTIEFVDVEDDRRHLYEFKVEAISSHIDVFNLVAEIHRLAPEMNLVSEAFAKRLFPHLSKVAITLGKFSYATRLVANYWFLFPMDMRLTFVRVTSFNLCTALTTIHQVFDDIGDSSKFDEIRVKCQVDRKKIWEDGLVVIERLAPGRCHLDIEFKGEEGIGAGPTQEFFTLFMRAICESKDLWQLRNDAESDVIPQNGLFPRPDADPHLFYILGITLAKAFSMSCVCDLPLNPVFFEIVRAGDTLREGIHYDIDRQLYDSLCDDADAFLDLDMVYPGTTLELIPNGGDESVTEENVEDFIRLVKEKMLCKDQIEAFKRGFTRVLPLNALLVFSNEELSKLFCAKHNRVTVRELEENVTLAQGYDPVSPTIRNLFEVLTEMGEDDLALFWEFVTGSRFLPFGGLKMLNPPLTIAKKTPENSNKKPDELLPSVMTCTNYFKLPDYSTKGILSKQILTAIREGRGAFLLT